MTAATMDKMQPRLLLFDIDGTLIHSGGAGVEALKVALKERFEIEVIGDTPRDIACGKALGARTIAVATGSWNREKLAEHAPDFLIDDLSDVDRLIDTLGW